MLFASGLSFGAHSFRGQLCLENGARHHLQIFAKGRSKSARESCAYFGGVPGARCFLRAQATQLAGRACTMDPSLPCARCAAVKGGQ